MQISETVSLVLNWLSTAIHYMVAGIQALLSLAVAPEKAMETAGFGSCAAAQDAAKVERHEEAVQLYTDCLKTAPLNDLGFSAVLTDRGNSLLALNKAQEAYIDYTIALEFNGEDATAYFNRGIASRQAGRDESALADFAATLRIKPDHTGAHYNRGLINMARSNYTSALNDFSSVLVLEPQEASAHYYIGYAYAKQGSHENAIENFSAYLSNNPEVTSAHLYRAESFAALAQFDQASADYTSAISIDDSDPTLLFERGRMRLEAGRDKAAFDDWKTAVKKTMDGRSRRLDRTTLIWTFFYTGQFDEALMFLPVVSENDKNFAFLSLLRYSLELRRGEDKKDLLRTALSKVEEGGREAALLHRALGKGSDDKVLATVREDDAALRKSDLCEIHFYLGLIALNENNLDQAREHFGAARNGNVASFYEFTGARIELDRLSTG